MYIDGIGYFDDINIIQTQAQNVQQNNTVVSDFDKVLSAEQEKQNETKSYSLSDIFDEAAATYGVPVDLLKAIAYNESNFSPDATSSAGAMGIMQLMPSTAASLGVEDPYDPYQNIMGGAKLLSQLSQMYPDNLSLVIAAYNAGAGNVEKYGGIPPFDETQRYVAKVLKTLNEGISVEGITVTAQNTAASTESSQGFTQINNQLSEEILTSSSQANVVGSGPVGTDNLLSSMFKARDTYYSDSNLDQLFSYSDYQLLMYYFDHMLEIISSIGSDNSEDKNNNSLFSDANNKNNITNQYLHNSNILYNKNTINLI